MLEIVQDILAAEGKAEKIIQKAKDESAKIRAQADTTAESMLRDSREDARRLAGERLEKARESTKEETAMSLREEEQRIKRFADTHQDEIGQVVDEIVELIASGLAADRR
jgi:vacuolar-type H+-ATPase subunit H